MRALAVPVLGLVALACAGTPPPPPPPAPQDGPAPSGPRQNVLVIVIDDLGTDKVAAYGEVPNAPSTPNLDALARQGVLFRNAYAYATCSPTRAALLTGRYGRRYGLGGILEVGADTYELPLDEVLIPEMLAAATPAFTSVAVGKWHLAGFGSPSGRRHPNRQGFSHYLGVFANLLRIETPERPKRRGDYGHFELTVDGEARVVDGYPDSAYVDEAIGQMSTLPEPWFLYVAFNDVHEPWHVPPGDLNTTGVTEASTDREKFVAMVGAMDREVGRLLAGLDPERRARTTIVLLGDNGTEGPMILPPREADAGKGTLREGGTNVPLIVAGPLVARPGSESAALVHVVDLWPTVAEIAGVDPARILGADGRPVVLDGASLVPALRDPEHARIHDVVYTERFVPEGPPPYETDLRALRDDRYKVEWRVQAGKRAYFDLQGRHDDGEPLRWSALGPDERERLRALERTLEAMEQRLGYVGPR